MIRVVVVDDSPFLCRLMTSHLQSEGDIQVVGTALNGERALKLVEELRPNVVTLDLDMPGWDGLETLERIMRARPTAVVMVSGVSRAAASQTIKALDLGAVDFIPKYVPGVDLDPEALRRDIVSKVRVAARVKVIRSLSRGTRPETKSDADPAAKPALDRYATPLGIVVIGASTGGPLAIRELLGELPADFPVPIVVVQHMPGSLIGVLARQLDRQTSLRVREAGDGDKLEAGLVLVAPGDRHLLLARQSRVELANGPKIGGHRPSVDVSMQSAAQGFGSRACGVLLTGMGSDGALGLGSIRQRGGATMAQDEASCIVFGMPQRAIERGAAQHIASPAELGRILRRLCRLPDAPTRKPAEAAAV